MFAAGNICVREFIDQNDLRSSRENRVDIHFLEDGSLVFDLFARDLVYLRDQFLDAFAAVSFYDADDDVLAPAAPS